MSIFLITLLGVFLFSGLNAVGRDTNESVNLYYENQKLADYTIYKTVNANDIDKIRSRFDADFASSYSQDIKFNGVYKKVTSYVFQDTTFTVNIPEVLEGRLPFSSCEALIDEAFAYSNGVSVGNVLNLTLNGTNYDVSICGVARFPNHLYKGEKIPQKKESAIIKVYIENFESFNIIYLKATSSKEILRSELTQLTSSSYANVQILDRTENVSVRRIKSDIELVTSIMNIIPIVCFAALCFILYVNLSKRISDESYNIGVMSANGISNTKIAYSYALPLFVWVMVAGLVGALCGITLLPDVYLDALLEFYTLPTIIHGSWFYAVIMPLLILAVLSAGCLYLATKSIIKKTPSRLMRGAAKKSAKLFSKSEMPIIFKLSARNFVASKKKVFFTVVSSALCLALLLTAFLLDNSVDNLQNTIYGERYNYNYSLNWNASDSILYEDIKTDIEQSDCFTDVRYKMEFYGLFNSEKSVKVTIIDEENPCFNFLYNDEQIDLISDGVYLPTSYGRYDNISLVAYTGKTFTMELSVAGYYDDFGTSDVVITLGCIRQNAPLLHWYLLNGGATTAIYFSEKQNVTDAQKNDCIENLNQKYGCRFVATEHSVGADRYKKLFVVLDITQWLLFVICGTIMVLLILNISCLNIKERIKDYSVFKAMGVSERKFNFLSSLENYFSIFIACIGSIPIGVYITQKIIDVVIAVTGVTVYLHLYWWSLVVLFVGAFVVTTISNRLINVKISKVNIVNTLKVRE